MQRFGIQSLFYFAKRSLFAHLMEGETALMFFHKLDRFSEDIAIDAKGSLPKVKKILQEIIKKNKWKYKITKNADTVFRMMIGYGGKMI